MASGEEPAPKVDSIRWPQIISQIKAGNVIPIVGPELLFIRARPRPEPGAEGPAHAGSTEPGPADSHGPETPVSLEHVFAERLAEQLKQAREPGESRVRDVANAYLDKNGHDQRWVLNDAMTQALDLKEAPPALDLLAAIDGFKLFISVTPDLLLENAMNKIRFGKRLETQAIVNAPQLQKRDLPGDLRDLQGSYIFYPFGRVADYEFAITEEDTLEFLFELLAQSARFQHLFAAIRRSHLLFLGCNFPDWLTRFWIRALTGRSQPPRGTLALIADRYAREDKNLVLFLKRGAIQIYDSGDANHFVERLHEAWSTSRAGIHSAPTTFEERRVAPQVFISYSREGDSEAAKNVCDQLSAAGLVVWFDRNDMKSGDRITDAMRSNIERCVAFVPILSQTSAARARGYYREEWTTAIEHARRVSPRFPFLHPVVVDDLTPHSPNAAGVPSEFWQTAYTTGLAGQLPQSFAQRLRQLVRDSQS